VTADGQDGALAGAAGAAAGALAGVRVLDLTGGLAGPVAGMLLADLGADVIKIQAAGAGRPGERAGLPMWDRGKRVAVLDPAAPADLRALDTLAGGADIVLAGTTCAGLSYPELLARGLEPGQPGAWIVMPPYLLGETPWTGGRESGGLLFAWLGHAWSQSSYDDVPVDCLYPVALYMQAIWAATTAVALLAGRAAGRKLAPLAVAGGAHGGVLVSPGGFAAGRDEPHVHRPGGPGGTLPNYRCYRCQDSQWLFLGAFTTAFIERGFRACGAGWLLDDPRVGGDPAAVRLPGNLRWITDELDQIFVTRPRAEWLALLEAADVPAAPAGEPGGWLDHEQVQALGLRVEARDDAGRDIVMPGALIGLSRTPVVPGAPATARPAALRDLAPGWAVRPSGPPGAPRGGGAGDGGYELPLAGLRVLDLGTIIAGPYTATLLGELGAEVLKIERPPLGDEFRTAHGGRGGVGFSVYNRDQRSLLLDLAADRGREIFAELVRSSDVVVDNYRAGVLHRLGIDHASLSAVNRHISSVSISAFGSTGPLGLRPGFDPIIQAMSGVMRAQGGPDPADSPAFLTVPINDVLAAGLGALGACAALYARPRLGHGQLVSITLCASSCLLQSESLVRFPGSPAAQEGGRDFAGPGPLDRLYRAADGWFRFGSPGPADLAALASAGLARRAEPHPGGAAGSAVSGGRDVIDAVSRAVGSLSVTEVLRRAHAAGLPATAARQLPDLTRDEQLIRHGLLAVTEADDAGVARVGPGRWLDMPGLVTGAPGEAPQPGEHTDAILRQTGIRP
jgi:crotonobetainyl-CoA:carnitine CoA-transferase CaiB-like acyl-CoA transferase